VIVLLIVLGVSISGEGKKPSALNIISGMIFIPLLVVLLLAFFFFLAFVLIISVIVNGKLFYLFIFNYPEFLNILNRFL
jgi:hypothetical protein